MNNSLLVLFIVSPEQMFSAEHSTERSFEAEVSYSSHTLNNRTSLFASTPLKVSHFLLLLTGGPIHVSFPSGLTLAEVQRKNPLVVRGGRYRPPDCEARHRTAIIIPHRHREHHLKFLLYYLHPFLQRQQLNYGIYVIHQVKTMSFTK